jgi:hypothetical protein
MKKLWLWGGIGLGSLLIVLAGISPAGGETDQMGGDERPVMAASESPSFGTEDWVGPVETPSFGAEDFVVASIVTPSFGTEDWVGPSETPSFGTEDWVLASEAITFGAEDWIEGMEYSDAVVTGTLPEPAR